MIRCTKCHQPWGGPRNTLQLVTALNSVAKKMLELSDEHARTHLKLQLRILMAELDGYCINHQWERAAQEHHDAGEGAALVLGQLATPTPEQIESGKLEGARGRAGAHDGPAEPGAPSFCKVLPIRRDLGVRFRGKGTIYEQSSAGESLHVTHRSDDPDGAR